MPVSKNCGIQVKRVSTLVYYKGMKCLVTGSSGFIGSTLAYSLLKMGHEVVGIDCYTENYSRHLKEENTKRLLFFEKFTHFDSDLSELELGKILKDVESIFHLAGQASVHSSWGGSFELYTERNIEVTHSLLRAALEAGVGKFINSSSSSVYGRILSNSVNEFALTNPVSPYGVTKLAAENLVSLYGSEFGLKTISLRYFTVYGPKQRPDMAFNKLISAGITGNKFPLHGDGTQIRDFTYVQDVVEANIAAATLDLAPGTILNIGGGSPQSMNSVISDVEEILGVQINLIKQPLGPGNPLVTGADCTKAYEILNWAPKMEFYDGLKNQVKWQLEQT